MLLASARERSARPLHIYLVHFVVVSGLSHHTHLPEIPTLVQHTAVNSRVWSHTKCIVMVFVRMHRWLLYIVGTKLVWLPHNNAPIKCSFQHIPFLNSSPTPYTSYLPSYDLGLVDTRFILNYPKPTFSGICTQEKSWKRKDTQLGLHSREAEPSL